MTGQCKRCGSCCNPLRLGHTPAEIKFFAKRFPKSDAAFAAKHFRKITTQKALRINSHLVNMLYQHEMRGFFYECKLFNKKTRLCMAHDARPDLCKNYPRESETFWYNPECGFKEVKNNEDEVPVGHDNVLCV